MYKEFVTSSCLNNTLQKQYDRRSWFVTYCFHTVIIYKSFSTIYHHFLNIYVTLEDYLVHKLQCWIVKRNNINVLLIDSYLIAIEQHTLTKAYFYFLKQIKNSENQFVFAFLPKLLYKENRKYLEKEELNLEDLLRAVWDMALYGCES